MKKINRRIYTCCPNSECGAFQSALQFLTSYGIEPSMKVDNEGHHYFKFSIPRKWSINQKRDINSKLAEKINLDTQPCDVCLNVMYNESYTLKCKTCPNSIFVCEECMIQGEIPKCSHK